MKKYMLGLLLVLGLTACGDKAQENPDNGKPVVKIGVNLPLSGNLAQVGKAAQNSLQMALDKWNNKNTKYKYKLIIENDMAKPQQAALNTQRFINIEHTPAVMSVFGIVDRVVDDAANANKIISMSCSYGKGQVPEYGINTGAQNEEIYAEALKQLRKENVKTVSLVGSNAAVSNVILDYFVEHLPKDNIQVVADERYGLEERDFRISIQKTENLKPDYYLLMGVEPANSVWVKQYHELTSKKNFGSLGTFPQLQPGFFSYIEGRWTVYINGGTNEFVQAYDAKYHEPLYGCTTNMYDNLDMLITAFENVTPKEGEIIPSTKDVVTYIRNLKTWNGAFGKLKIGTDGIAHPQIDTRVYSNGTFNKI